MAGEELAGTDPYSRGKPCPKCGYVRSAADTNPAWQCPKCGIAYAKFGTALAPSLVAHGRALAAHASSDHTILVLVAANVVALGIAYATHMRLRELMLVYWIQSVIIGISYFIRILSLHRFSTENFEINNQPVEEVPATKRETAFFFLLHYGFFHVIYLVFIVFAGNRSHALGPVSGYVLCALVFAANHAYSLTQNIRADARGKPNIGTMMFLPYARILPMHATILAGGTLAATGSNAFFLFAGLKIVADVVMHSVEHYALGIPRDDSGIRD
jgi:hypothetical protein